MASVSTCGICLCRIRTSACGECAHHFCFACLVNTLAAGITRCPKCRLELRHLALDKEFDELLRLTCPPSAERSAPDLRRFERALTFGAGEHAGLTVERRVDGPGVVVTKLVDIDRAYACGVREQDVLLAVDGIACNSPRTAIELVEAGARRQPRGGATLVVLPRPS